MKNVFYTLTFLLLLILLPGCSSPDPEPATEDPVAFYATLQDENFTSWQRAPGHEVRQPGTGLHLSEVDTYINEIMADALNTNASEAPAGAIIAKNAFQQDQLNTTVAMRKRSDGSWFFAQWNAEGEVMTAGIDEPSCITCHTSNNDRILAFPLSTGGSTGY